MEGCLIGYWRSARKSRKKTASRGGGRGLSLASDESAFQPGRVVMFLVAETDPY